MTTAADNPYLRDAVMTATPEQLQLMLYDGALRYCLQGRESLSSKRYEESYERLTRAQNIILEMQAGLNFDVNPELCKRVASVYNFLYRKLVDANVKHDVQAIDDAVRVLRIERETWQLLVDKVIKATAEDTSTRFSAPAAPSSTSSSSTPTTTIPSQPVLVVEG